MYCSQLFEYERLVKILLHAVSDTEQEGFVQRIAIYLLNSLACLVDGKQKLFLGDLGAIAVSYIFNGYSVVVFIEQGLQYYLFIIIYCVCIQTMLSLIYDRLTRQVFDDVMEVAWSTMWNVTDETAINCERFLDGRGMEYFLECLQVSHEHNFFFATCLQLFEHNSINFYYSPYSLSMIKKSSYET